MNYSTIQKSETARIQALQSLHILDTPPEERFDRLTRLAKEFFNVPMALVSLVDTDRQWFKSKIGLSSSETPRSVSFCTHAILGDETFIVPDAFLDPRFSESPLVTGDPNIRFYAGRPLRLNNGEAIGTLCIIDTEPRVFNSKDRQVLEDLALIAESELSAIQMAIEDDLTGLPNRRGFLHQAQKTINLCYRLKRPAVLIFFDLKDFKQINDQFGHEEGDVALKAFAGLLDKHTRESDISARLYGDEFVLLMSDATMESGIKFINRLSKEVHQHNQNSGKNYEIHFNEGMVPLDLEKEHSIHVWLKQADIEMYLKKRKHYV